MNNNVNNYVILLNVLFSFSLQTDKVIYFATEAVTPLENYLNESDENRNLLAISWGLHQISVSLNLAF